MPSEWRGWVNGVVTGAALWAAACGCDREGGGVAPDQGAGRGVSAELAQQVATVWPGEEAAAGAGEFDVEVGRELFMASCAACHGTGGQGMPNQGPDLRASALTVKSSDDEILAFLAKGRQVGDPQSVMGLPMPPRGGNAALSNRQLAQIVKFLRTVASPGGQATTATETAATETAATETVPDDYGDQP